MTSKNFDYKMFTMR